MKQFLLLVFIIGLCFLEARAQSKSFEDVLEFSVQNMGVIRDHQNQVTGYYMYYFLDKESRRERRYLMQIMDENLNTVTSFEVVKNRNVFLNGLIHADNAFFLVFNNPSRYQYSIDSYDMEGNKLAELELPSDRIAYTSEVDLRAQGVFNLVVPQNGGQHGLIMQNISRQRRIGYHYRCFDRNLKLKWETQAHRDQPNEMPEVIEVSDNFMLSRVLTVGMARGSGSKWRYVVIDLRNGKNREIDEFEASEYRVMPTTLSINEDTETIGLIGEYYELGASIASARNLGFFIGESGFNGKVNKVSYNSWVDDFSQHMDVSELGKIDDDNYVVVLESVRSPEGKTFMFGEMYKRQASAAGIVLTVLSGGKGSPTELVIGDIVLMVFDEHDKIESVHRFDKFVRKVPLPGLPVVNSGFIAQYMRRIGGFDFSFSTSDFQRNRHFITYTSRIEEEGKRPRDLPKYVGTVVIDEDLEIVRDRITIDPDASSFWVMRAKPGYIAIFEHFRSERRLKSRLERINF